MCTARWCRNVPSRSVARVLVVLPWACGMAAMQANRLPNDDDGTLLKAAACNVRVAAWSCRNQMAFYHPVLGACKYVPKNRLRQFVLLAVVAKKMVQRTRTVAIQSARRREESPLLALSTWVAQAITSVHAPSARRPNRAVETGSANVAFTPTLTASRVIGASQVANLRAEVFLADAAAFRKAVHAIKPLTRAARLAFSASHDAQIDVLLAPYTTPRSNVVLATFHTTKRRGVPGAVFRSVVVLVVVRRVILAVVQRIHRLLVLFSSLCHHMEEKGADRLRVSNANTMMGPTRALSRANGLQALRAHRRPCRPLRRPRGRRHGRYSSSAHQGGAAPHQRIGHIGCAGCANACHT